MPRGWCSETATAKRHSESMNRRDMAQEICISAKPAPQPVREIRRGIDTMITLVFGQEVRLARKEPVSERDSKARLCRLSKRDVLESP